VSPNQSQALQLAVIFSTCVKVHCKIEMDYEDWDGLMLLYDLEHAEMEQDQGPRIFHVRDDAFLLNKTKFHRLFRLSKRMADTLIQRIEQLVPEPSRKSAINVQSSVSNRKIISCRIYRMKIISA
jgi:hypothetical protein